MDDMHNIKPKLQEKIQQLEQWFTKRKGSIVAFSGGIDSSLVLFLARKYQGKENVLGIISNSESLKRKDFVLAKKFCNKYDINLEVIKTLELKDDRYNQNPENRCYYCKGHLFKDLQTIKDEYKEFDILSGTNVEDLGEYRPGLQAESDFKVLSPLAECHLSKNDIRQIAKYFKLFHWDKPASPCLSSRIPYYQTVTKEKLQQVEEAENILNDMGFKDVRVRHYGDWGQIEVQKDDLEKLLFMEKEVSDKIKKLGFKEIKIDKEGFVSGKLNRILKNKAE